MKKLMILGLIALLLVSVVSAAGLGQRQLSYEDLLNENIKLRSQLTLERQHSISAFTSMLNRCIFIKEDQQYFSIDLGQSLQSVLNPTVRRSSSVRTVTETEYIQCEVCVWKGCRIPTERQIGTTEPDSCGCTEAICEDIPNPVPPNPRPTPHIKPVLEIK